MWFGRIAVIALVCSLSGAAQAQLGCVTVDATKGWQLARFANAPVQITDIYGSWTVDSALAQTNWNGHQGRDAERLAPYSAYSYDASHAFGRLLVRAENSQNAYPVQPRQGAQAGTIINVEWAELRINDSDASLVDNAGTLNVCFEPWVEGGGTGNQTASPPQASTSASTVNREAWMACFNDSRQSDADRSALQRQRSDLRSQQRELDRRADDLQAERNMLSLSYNRDEFGIADRARANQQRMHQERVDRYNADVRAMNSRLTAYDQRAADFNVRNDAWRARCGGVFNASALPLVQQYCVGEDASTSFCTWFQ